MGFAVERTSCVGWHLSRGNVFGISMVLISILRSTMDDVLSEFHSLTKVWSLMVCIVSLGIIW